MKKALYFIVAGVSAIGLSYVAITGLDNGSVHANEVNLVKNGSFENPVVETGGWDIFDAKMMSFLSPG